MSNQNTDKPTDKPTSSKTISIESSPSNRPSSASDNLISASPREFASIPEIQEAAKSAANIAMANEIVINENFKIQKPEDNPLYTRVRSIAEQAFWDIFEENLKADPPNYSHAILLLEDIKASLLSLLNHQPLSVRQTVEEGLDIELIRQQCEHSALDIHKYANFIITTMASLCAPARDQQVAQLRQLEGISELFRGILETLDVMSKDYANFLVANTRGIIAQEYGDYVGKHFQSVLQLQKKQGIDGLQQTRQWLEEAVTKVKDDSELPFSPNTVLIQAFVQLLDWDPTLPPPETLAMDMARFLQISWLLRRICLIASILLLTQQVCGGEQYNAADFRDKLKNDVAATLSDVPDSELNEALKGISELVVKRISEHAVTLHKTVDPASLQVLQGQLSEVSQPEHRVRKLLWKRVESFYRQLLTTRPNNSSISLAVPPGLGSMSTELSDIGSHLFRLTSFNRAAFGRFYSEILTPHFVGDGATVGSGGETQSPS